MLIKFNTQVNLVTGATVWRLGGSPEEPQLESVGELTSKDSSATVDNKYMYLHPRKIGMIKFTF